ncbi:hypothetical protein VTK26DRAFT_1421 [Humicola hyalothermophila]
MSQDTRSLVKEPEGSPGLSLLGDNVREELGILLAYKVEAQLDSVERCINEGIDAYRQDWDGPFAELAGREAAIECLMEQYKAKKTEIYSQLVYDSGEKQAEKVFTDLAVWDRIPKSYVDFVHETWDVVGLEEASHVREALEEDPVFVPFAV